MAGRLDTDGFADYLSRIQGKLPATVTAYVKDCVAFDGYCRRNKWKLGAGLTRPRAGLYLVERTGDGPQAEGSARLGSRSAARLVSALKALASYLVFTGELAEDTLAGFTPPKYQRPLPDYFNSDELRQLVCAFDDAPLGKPLLVRNAAILHMLYATGIRVSECAGLDIQSVDRRARLVSVLGKGRKQRIAPFGDSAAAALERYLHHARSSLTAPDSHDALWLNHRGGRLSPRAMRDVINQATIRAGQLKHVSPHKLRHACATHLLEGGADIRLIQELLGHESIDTTQAYTQVTRTHLREAYEQTHPRSGGKKRG